MAASEFRNALGRRFKVRNSRGKHQRDLSGLVHLLALAPTFVRLRAVPINLTRSP